MRRRSLPASAVAALLVASGWSCKESPPAPAPSAGTGTQAAQDGKGTLKVGLLNPTTGPFAALGTDVNAGFDLYVKSKGGKLSGYTIEALKQDEGTDAAQATTKARQLVERDKVQIVIGLVNSAIAYAVAPYLEQANVPLLITVAGADGLTRKQGGNTYRISYTGSQDVMPLGTYTCKTLRHAKAVVLSLDYSFGWESSGGFARTYEDAGCKVVQEIYAPLGTQDWAPYVNQISNEAAVIYTTTPGQDGVRMLKAYRDFGGKRPIVAHGSSVDETLLPTQGATAEGVISGLHYSAQLDSPENKAFAAAFTQATQKSPNQYAEDGWAAGMILEQALSRVEGEITPQKIRAALAKVSVKAPRGPLSFDAYGQAVYNVYIRKVEQKDGKWVNAIVDTVPNVSQFYQYEPDKYLEFPTYDKLKGSWVN
ncbi:MAG TPA: ABC transporter substrate-binding protein [Myxococcaceae bacterium]|nr:ABC transporter substrate-binding protein [Myxococcaceae bacterium]